MSVKELEPEVEEAQLLEFTPPTYAVVQPPRRRLNLRRLIIPVAAVLAAIAIFFGVNMYREGQMYVSTDNASSPARRSRLAR